MSDSPINDPTSAAGRRPLSPHLQIYKPMLTMMMSIVHRITGMAMYFGIAIFVWWLLAAASSQGSFDFIQAILTSFIGLLGLFILSWTLIHHTLGGLKHLIWDVGHGYDLKLIELLAKGSLIGSAAMTVLLWLVIIIAR